MVSQDLLFFGCDSMPDTLQMCAQNYKTLTQYNYIIITGNSKRVEIHFDLKFIRENFTHITGLDHLDDLDGFGTHKLVEKLRLFQEILDGKVTYTDIQKSIKFYDYIQGTYNNNTGKCYTIADRLNALVDLESLLDNMYVGKLYHWRAYTTAKTANGKYRQTSIRADYVLQIPKQNGEYIYLFLYEENKAQKKNAQKRQDTIKLTVFSAFPDCIDFASVLGKALPWLQIEKENKKTHNRVLLYQNVNYKSNKL